MSAVGHAPAAPVRASLLRIRPPHISCDHDCPFRGQLCYRGISLKEVDIDKRSPVVHAERLVIELAGSSHVTNVEIIIGLCYEITEGKHIQLFLGGLQAIAGTYRRQVTTRGRGTGDVAPVSDVAWPHKSERDSGQLPEWLLPTASRSAFHVGPECPGLPQAVRALPAGAAARVLAVSVLATPSADRERSTANGQQSRADAAYAVPGPCPRMHCARLGRVPESGSYPGPMRSPAGLPKRVAGSACAPARDRGSLRRSYEKHARVHLV